MTVNITALINNLGSTYENINDAKLIPYKSKPRGDSGDTEISLNMVKEGVFLAFVSQISPLNRQSLSRIQTLFLGGDFLLDSSLKSGQRQKRGHKRVVARQPPPPLLKKPKLP